MSKTMRITIEFGEYRGDYNAIFFATEPPTVVETTTQKKDKLTDEYSPTFLCDRGRAAVKEALIAVGEIE